MSTPTDPEPQAQDTLSLQAPSAEPGVTLDATTVPQLGQAPTDRAPEGKPLLPGYEVLGELGRGGMGVVYRARQVQANRLVALKMIRSGALASGDELARFQREARAVARLHHPNIVQVYEVGEYHGQPYFSLELCGGGSLDKYLAGTPLPTREAARLLEVLARAIHAAHEQQIVHRDLKPANILLSGEGRGTGGERSEQSGEEPSAPHSPLATRPSSLLPRITDFGLARKLDEVGQTRSGAVMGTPSYMAPEQAAGKGKEAGPAADVWALGAILYECLTGRPPFRAATPLDTILQVLSEEPVPPRRLNAGTPRDLETVCLKCLQKEPASRYDSAASLAEDLRRFQAGEPIQARPAGRLERGWRWCRRNPAVASLLSLVVLLLVGGLALAWGLAWSAELARQSAEEQARQARREEADAELERTKAVEASEELQRSRGRLEQSAARSLLRPLGLQGSGPLSGPEVTALTELAGGRRELRLAFVEQASRRPLTARQLSTRAGFALHAAVGLGEAPRDEAERILLARLEDSKMTAEHRGDVALTLALLGGLSRVAADRAGTELSKAMSQTTSVDRLQQLRIALALAEPGISREAASRATDTLSKAMAETSDDKVLAEMAQAQLLLATRSGPEAVTRDAERITQALTRTDSTRLIVELTRSLSVLAPHLGPRDAARVAKTLQEGIRNLRSQWDLSRLLWALDGVVASMEPQAASVTCAEVIGSVLQQVKGRFDTSPYKDAVGAMNPLAGRLGPREAAQVLAARRPGPDAPPGGDPGLPDSTVLVLASRLGPMEQADALAHAALSDNRSVLEELAARLDALAPSLRADELQRHSARLMQAMEGAKDSSTRVLLARAVMRLSMHQDPKGHADRCGRVASALLVVKRSPEPPDPLMAALAGMPPNELAALIQQIRAGGKGEGLTQDVILRVADRLDAKDRSALCRPVADRLANDVPEREFDDAEHFAKSLVDVSTRLEPGEAASLLARTASEAGLPEATLPLCERLVALGPRLGPMEAAATAGLLVAAFNRKPDKGNKGFTLKVEYERPLGLAQALAALGPAMEPKEYAAAARVATAVLVRELGGLRSDYHGGQLGEALGQVLRPMPSQDALALLKQARADAPGGLVLSGLNRSLMAITAGMKPEEAIRVLSAERERSNDLVFLGTLAVGVARAARQLPAREAAPVCRRWAAPLLEALDRMLARGEDAAVVEGLIALAPGLEPAEALSALRRAFEANLPAQSTILRAIAAEAPRQDARAAANTILQMIARASPSDSFEGLPAILAGLLARLDRPEASTLAGRATLALLEAVPRTPEGGVRPATARGIATLAAFLSPDDAGRASNAFLATLAKDSHPETQIVLSTALVTVSERLPPERRARVVESLLQRLDPSRPGAPTVPGPALSILAASLKPGEAAEACRRAALLRCRVDSLVFLQGLAPYLAPEGRLEVAIKLLPLMHAPLHWSEVDSCKVTFLAVLTGLPPARLPLPAPVAAIPGLASRGDTAIVALPALLHRLSTFCPLSTGQMLELLGQPLCVGEPRRVVLTLLEQRYQRRFTDHWEVARFVSRQGLTPEGR